jgi:hypothetical protein
MSDEINPHVKRRTLVYPIMLDDGYIGQLVIPADLSADECRRITEFLASLVVPWREHDRTR